MILMGGGDVSRKGGGRDEEEDSFCIGGGQAGAAEMTGGRGEGTGEKGGFFEKSSIFRLQERRVESRGVRRRKGVSRARPIKKKQPFELKFYKGGGGYAK